MSNQLVITALGADHPGIVEELSTSLNKHQLNIEESRMSALGGEFAVLLLVSGSEQAIDDFVAKSSDIETQLQMKLMLKTTKSSSDQRNLAPYDIEVLAIDNPGIVQKLAGFFSSREINIFNLDTELYHAPHTGTPMFSLRLTVGVPAGTPIAKLREEFMSHCDDLNLDAEMQASS